ncbi:hypothetical protein GCM10020331_088860 [Ectobacillus funiculus]
MLTGILTPTSGRITVNGMNPHREREKVCSVYRCCVWTTLAALVGYCCSRIIPPVKKVYGVSDEQYEAHMGHIIETLDISALLDKPVRKLSLGQRMRCELAAALLHNPPLLFFLDEPTIGLDVLVKLKKFATF